MIKVIQLLLLACNLDGSNPHVLNDEQRKCQRLLVKCADKVHQKVKSRPDLSPTEKEYVVLKECLTKNEDKSSEELENTLKKTK